MNCGKDCKGLTCETCNFMLWLSINRIYGKSPHSTVYRNGAPITLPEVVNMKCERYGANILRPIYGVHARLERRPQ